MARSRGPLFPELGFLPRRRHRHVGERPAVITAISVSGIFQPFLVSPFSSPPSSSASSTSTTTQHYRELPRECTIPPPPQKFNHSLYIVSRSYFENNNCELQLPANPRRMRPSRVCSQRERKKKLFAEGTPPKNGPWTL